MRFFYAVTLFLISLFVLFWTYIFLIPTPKLELRREIPDVTNTYSEQAVIQALQYVRSDDKSNLYTFETNLENKRSNVSFVYALLASGLIFLTILLFHWRSYIVFPLVASVIVVTIICMSLWMGTNTISKSIYLDLQDLRSGYEGLKALQFLSMFFAIEMLVIIFGAWYDI